jgi:type IV secretion system protein VirB6
MLSCVGFGLAARLAQAIVLAAGPLFIAAALFDLSIGLFMGWLRALAALFLAQTGYAVSSALELAFIAKDAAHLSQGAADSGQPLLLGLFFLAAGGAITLVAVLAASALRRIEWGRHVGAMTAPKTTTEALPAAQSPWSTPEIRLDPPVSRAQRVTDAVGALASAEDQRRGGSRDTGVPAAGAASTAATDSLANAGPGLRRPGQLRASTGAAKRDLIT